MVQLKKSFYKRKNRLENRGSNPPKRAYNKMQALGPIIFGLFFAPAIIATTLISQTAFLMIANILLSVGSLLTIGYGLYEKIRDKKYQAAFWEFMFTAAIMTGLFFLAFNYAPLIAGSGFLATLCFMNLFASSINVFMLMRLIVLPPLLATTQYILSKLGLKSSIELESAPDFDLECDDCANELITKNYTDESIINTENKDWKIQALLPFNKSKELIYKYIDKYLKSFFGAIERSGEIKSRQANYDSMVENRSIDGSHNVFFKNKLIAKSLKVQRLTNAYKECLENPPRAKPLFAERKKILEKYFNKSSVKEKVNHEEYLTALKTEIFNQYRKLITVLECFPLHMALDHLQKVMSISLSDSQVETLKKSIINEGNLSIYTQGFKDQNGLNLVESYSQDDLFEQSLSF